MVYRKLLRSRLQVFAGDAVALDAARTKIRAEFRKNSHLTEPSDIQNWIKVATETADFMKFGVIQAHASNPGIYRLNITKDTHLHDSVPLKKTANVNLNDYKLPGKNKINDKACNGT